MVMVIRLLIAGVIGGKDAFKPHLGAPSRGEAPSLVSRALRAPFSGCVSSHLAKRGRVCWEGAELMALQHSCGSCLTWGLFMVSGKISDERSGQDISNTLLGALPALAMFRSSLNTLKEWVSCPSSSQCWSLGLRSYGGYFSGRSVWGWVPGRNAKSRCFASWGIWTGLWAVGGEIPGRKWGNSGLKSSPLLSSPICLVEKADWRGYLLTRVTESGSSVRWEHLNPALPWTVCVAVGQYVLFLLL